MHTLSFKRIGISAILLSGLLAACSSRVELTPYPTGAEQRLPTLSTYCWAVEPKANALAKQEPLGGHHPEFDRVVRETIVAVLGEKGYSQTDCASAGFVIDYRMASHDDIAAADASAAKESEANSYGPRWRIGENNTVDYQGLTAPKENIVTVRHGTIHVGAFTAQNNMLWHSSAEKNLGSRDVQTNPAESITRTVRRLLESFPARR